MIVKGVIFDCDGVLVDSEELSIRALLFLAAPYGCSITLPQGLKLFHGKSFQECVSLIQKKCNLPLPSDFETAYRQLSFEYFQKNLKPVKGVKEFIDNLTVPFCVASSGPVDKIRLNLSLVNLLTRFEGKIFSCYDINAWKPDPAIFLHAAAQMKFRVSECIVIEDSVPGVIAAVNGGFKVFAYANENSADELKKAGAIVFHYFADLPAILSISLHP